MRRYLLSFSFILVLNNDMLEGLKKNSAPTGTWVKGGGKVPYPQKDGVNKYTK
jgi:hypothetical protein